MKQTFEGWTVAAKILNFGKEQTCFMGTHKFSSNKYVTLETYPTNINVLENLHETKEDAIDFWKTGMWDLCISRESISPILVKIKVDVMCLGLDWNGM